MGVESEPLLASHVLGLAIFIALIIFDLRREISNDRKGPDKGTYIHIEDLSITFSTVYNSCDHHEGVS